MSIEDVSLNSKRSQQKFISDYRELGSINKLADKWGMSYTTARAYLYRFEVPVKVVGRPSRISKMSKKQKEKFVSDYHDLKSIAKLSKKWDMSWQQARMNLSYLGQEHVYTSRQPSIPLTEEQKQDFRQDYDNFMSIRGLAEKWDLSYRVASSLLKELGASIRKGRVSKLSKFSDEEKAQFYKEFKGIMKKWDVSLFTAYRYIKILEHKYGKEN